MGTMREESVGSPTLTHVGSKEATIPVRRLSFTVTAGPDKGAQWTSDKYVSTIGSHPSCEFVLEDPTVSRFHCEVSVRGDRVKIRDLNSRNGTVLGTVQVLEALLHHGAEIRLGSTVLQVDFGAEAAQVELASTGEFGSLVGSSVAMRTIFSRLSRAAATDATVLLTGETGTGKTASARAIHQASGRSAGPFVVLDCGAVPANLLESELFGHERGAYTGAVSRRVGAFEEADGGTLVLDEIGELPLELQPKLLGILESRQVRSLGANSARPVDVRVIAATNRDLRAEVNAGRFRSDLYYRLAVIEIAQPALRDRLEDVAQLARPILASLGASSEQMDKMLTKEFVARLQGAPWPGNVRELRNYLERCLVFDDAVPVEPLTGATGTRNALTGPSVPIATDREYAEARRAALGEFERLYLTTLLNRNEGNVAVAAEEAGIDRTYFYRLLRRHGLKV